VCILLASICWISQLALGQTTASEATEQKLKNVAAIHGAAGVFAVAGYRMGERALNDLGLPRGSFAIGVVHHTPSEVQWSCISDGLQAATGASAGKLNLKLVTATKENVETVVTNRKTGKRLVFRLQPEFIQRFLNLPYEKQPAAGREAAEMPESKIFSVALEAASPQSAKDH
jgi:formylmethanofuran dehydrogenase subunit E